MRRSACLIIVIASLVSGGCGKLSDQLAPQGSFRAIHAVPDLYQAVFFVRDRQQATLEYGGNTARNRVGVDRYPFSVKVRKAGQDDQLALEFEADIREGEEAIFVFTGDAANLGRLTWRRPEVEVGAGRVAPAFGHAGQGLGPVDVYLEGPGADLLAATPVASLASGGFSTAGRIDAGDYQLTVTAPGDPATVLFASATLSLAGGTEPLFVLLDTAGTGTTQLLVRAIGAGGVGFVEDLSSAPVLRAAHASLGGVDVDVAIDGDFASPLIGNLAFQQLSGYQATTADPADLAIAQAGTAGGVLLAQDNIDLVSGTFNSSFFLGAAGAEEVVTVSDTRRPFAEFAQLRLVQAAANFSNVDVYVVPAGKSFSQFAPVRQGLSFRTVTGNIVLRPRDYDIVVTENLGTKVLARVDGVTLNELGLYGVMITDNTDPALVDLVLFDDFVAP
ncbi:MAG: DUF4397 domain-containing protein [Gammaproteobacteria bacterium]|nr:MAG: DUF4397 domain-containing protein [Gammaproteobacteria bacterium]